MFAAVLDTCVLWPSRQRDLLLSLGVELLYRPLWSSAILDELEFHESRKLHGRGVPGPEAARRARGLIDAMTTHFADALVTGWESLEGTFGLPDPDDEHVVAAAVIAGADVIVTYNVKDLPAGLVPEHIDVQRPPEFIAHTVTVDPGRAAAAVRGMLGRYRNPPVTIEGLLVALETRYGLHDAVAELRKVC